MRWLFALLTGLVTGLTYPSPWFFFLSVGVYEVGLLFSGVKADVRILLPVAAGYVLGWFVARQLRPTYHRLSVKYNRASRTGSA